MTAPARPTSSPSAAPRPEHATARVGAWLGAVIVAALLAALGAAAFTGASNAPPTGINDPGAGVRSGIFVVRVVHDLAAALTVGTLLVTVSLAPRGRAAALRLLSVSAFGWAVASLVWVVLAFADLSGLRLTDPVFGAQLVDTAWSIEPLRIAIIVALLAGTVATAAVFTAGHWTPVWLGAASVLALLLLGLSAHAGGSTNHETAVNAMATHIVAATVWVGGLAAIITLRSSFAADLATVVRRYSTVALWCFVALGISGVIAATTRLASPADLTTRYGLVLLGKVGLFAVLGGFGWLHRRRSVALLERSTTQPDAAHNAGAFARFAGGEVVVMALAMGLAAALSRTAPPVPETVPNPSAALTITGFPAPEAPNALSWLTDWRVEWLFLAIAVLAVGVYLAGVARLRGRGDRWPVGRTLAWLAGWAVFVWATNGALGIYGRVAFSWHMTLHMVQAMVVPILLVLGAPVSLALRAWRRRGDGTIGPRELLLGVVHSRYLRVVGNPIFAGAFFFFSLVVFYYTPLFELALTTHTGHVLMTVHFLLAGYFFAWVLIGVDPGPPKWSPALRLLVLFATMGFHAFFGVSIMNATTPLAADVLGQIALPWVPDLLTDQKTGGSVAWAIGELPTLALALIVSVQWATADRKESRRHDRQADRDGDAELAAYNERLARLSTPRRKSN